MSIVFTMDEILSQMSAEQQMQNNHKITNYTQIPTLGPPPSCFAEGIDKKQDADMESATYENVKPFIPDIRMGKVIRVYDGDTITIAARFHIDDVVIPKLFRYSVRLRRIDSPEKKTKNKKEKELAIKSRDALSNLIMGKVVILENIEYDKYGRVLAEIMTEDGINVSDWMLTGGFAVEYDGGTKHRPAEWTDVEV
jgi:endonuclease YncB( thermonuclease family)